ncbi:MAG: hypothetical protein EPO42_01370 [Gallionellaceae bacterium]|nr:MAG: hypothetical protein EPO42_01370 [Gallionellaceae bacterium]
MTIALSVFFDAAYLEPALVTAFDVIKAGLHPNVHKLYLVYLKKSAEVDHEVAAILQSFAVKFSVHIPVVAISVTNSLGELSSHHFNNSIIYKGIVPTLIPTEQFILNIDAGILVGGLFGEFIRRIKVDYCGAEQNWVVAAHCNPTGDGIPQALASHSRHAMYPAGNLLLFNADRYASHRWIERYLRNYSEMGAHLEYAEQELICLTAAESELISLPGIELRQMEFLGLNVLLGEEPLSIPDLRDKLIYKVVGSLKPWKYWVLDPRKAIYTRKRAELEAEFPLSGNRLIEAERMLCSREDYWIGFLKAYDRYTQYLPHQPEATLP